MPTQQLIGQYLRLRGQLASALASDDWKSCRLGHIERVSRELAPIEQALEQQCEDDDLYVALMVGGRVRDRSTP